MRNAILVALIGVGTMVVAVGWGRPAQEAYGLVSAQGPAGDGGLITLMAASDESGQHLVLIDPRIRVMGVYHIKRESGEVTLKSVRNFKWDLQMLEYNGTSPLPQDIRGMMESR